MEGELHPNFVATPTPAGPPNHEGAVVAMKKGLR